VACFSMQQSKHITSGEGGIIAMDDPEMYKRALLLANCGMPWYRHGLEAPKAEPLAGFATRGHFAYGHNYRMGELAAAVGLAQLERIDEFNDRRKKFAEIIEDELADAPGVDLAYVYPDTVPNYWIYPIRVPAEMGSFSEINYFEVAYQKMQEERRTAVGYPLPDYVQYKPGICPKAEAASKLFTGISCQHNKDFDEIRESAQAIRKRAEEVAAS